MELRLVIMGLSVGVRPHFWDRRLCAWRETRSVKKVITCDIRHILLRGTPKHVRNTESQ